MGGETVSANFLPSQRQRTSGTPLVGLERGADTGAFGLLKAIRIGFLGMAEPEEVTAASSSLSGRQLASQPVSQSFRSTINPASRNPQGQPGACFNEAPRRE